MIDPKVVKKSLLCDAPPMEQYRAALKASAEKIGAYTAARITLWTWLRE
ncbi:hypothetical protein [Dulcicalothrix desertica]|nr:hypothetical protein [Dulcicalothrix desertica]